jgi:hypothetical protein
LRPCMSNLFRTTSRNYWQQNPFFICRSFHYVYAPSAMHAVMHAVMNSASLGAVATYGLVSDQSPSAFLEVQVRLVSARKRSYFTSIKTPSWNIPHHTTPRLYAPQREFGVESHKWNMYLPGLGQGRVQIQIQIQSQMMGMIFGKVQTQVPPTSNSAPHGPFWSLSVCRR